MVDIQILKFRKWPKSFFIKDIKNLKNLQMLVTGLKDRVKCIPMMKNLILHVTL